MSFMHFDNALEVVGDLSLLFCLIEIIWIIKKL